jgi:hypothetical protein
MSENVKSTESTETTPASANQPNEHGTVSVQGFVRIWDPNTANVFVEKRA